MENQRLREGDIISINNIPCVILDYFDDFFIFTSFRQKVRVYKIFYKNEIRVVYKNPESNFFIFDNMKSNNFNIEKEIANRKCLR